MSDGTPSAERQSFLPAGAAGRYSIQHSVQPRAEEEELSDHWQQDTDANAGLRPPACAYPDVYCKVLLVADKEMHR
jgi:hypothetical protein